MSATLTNVEKLAKLASLEVSQSQKAELQQDIEHILSWIKCIDKLPKNSLKTPDSSTPLRKDEPKASAISEQVLKQAPEAEAGLFTVPKVMKHD